MLQDKTFVTVSMFREKNSFSTIDVGSLGCTVKGMKEGRKAIFKGVSQSFGWIDCKMGTRVKNLGRKVQKYLQFIIYLMQGPQKR